MGYATSLEQIEAATLFPYYAGSRAIAVSNAAVDARTLWSTPTSSIAAPADRSLGGTLVASAPTGFLPPPSGDSQMAVCRFFRDESSVVNNMYVGRSFLTIFYDVAWYCGGFDATSIAEQAISSFPALTRPDANGSDLEAFLWVRVTPSSTTSSNATLKYTDSAGNAGKTATLALGAATNGWSADRVLPFAANAGDRGIKVCESVTFSDVRAAAGTIVLCLGRPVAIGMQGWGLPSDSSPLLCGLQKLTSDMALFPVCPRGFEGTNGGMSFNSAIDYLLAKA